MQVELINNSVSDTLHALRACREECQDALRHARGSWAFSLILTAFAVSTGLASLIAFVRSGVIPVIDIVMLFNGILGCVMYRTVVRDLDRICGNWRARIAEATRQIEYLETLRQKSGE